MSPRRCLVVRPEPGCAATVRRIDALEGWHGIGVPLTDRMGTDALIPTGAFDAVALTSAAAVRFLGEIDRDVPIHAIGTATAAAARAVGFVNVQAGADGRPAGDGTALGTALASAYRGRTVLYPCAEERRPGFEDAAAANGICILPWPVYRTVPLADGADRLRDALSHAPDAAMVHAPSSARALGEAWPPEWRPEGVAWLAMSAAIADALPAHMPSQRHVATRPDEAAMIDLLRSV